LAGKLSVITGATGLLGSHIAEQLVAQGERVRALVRATSDVAFLRQLGVELIFCDIRNRASLPPAIAGADVLYHAAARVGDWGSWPAFREEVVDTTRNVMEACREVGVGRVLHVSSVAVYGRPRMPPGGVREDHPLERRPGLWEHYCRAKVEAEGLVRRHVPQAAIVRPTWLFGPRDRNGLPRLIHALRGGWVSLVGPGDNLLNILHVADVAAGAIRAAQSSRAAGQVYHLCSEGEITQRQFLDTLTDHLELPRVTRQVPWRLAHWSGFAGEALARLRRWNRAPYVTRYSVGLVSRPVEYRIDKASQELGWRAEQPIREGLITTLKWLEDAKLGCLGKTGRN
jgi:nucleoside-diphosphate-sugar epimerase